MAASGGPPIAAGAIDRVEATGNQGHGGAEGPLPDHGMGVGGDWGRGGIDVENAANYGTMYPPCLRTKL